MWEHLLLPSIYAFATRHGSKESSSLLGREVSENKGYFSSSPGEMYCKVSILACIVESSYASMVHSFCFR